MLRFCIGRLIHVIMVLAFSAGWLQMAHAQNFLAPEKAFRVSAKMADANTLEIHYDIVDGYYMYREPFAFTADGGATLGTATMPDGVVKFDENFGKDVETYRHSHLITLPVQAQAPFILHATSQGCSDEGLCYPPMTVAMDMTPEAIGVVVYGNPSDAPPQAASQTEMGSIMSALESRDMLVILPLFLLLGIGLSFTPCVLPMVPILSSIIVGDSAQAGRRRSFVLSLVYSLGMALVYTALGVTAGLLGEGLAASLQKPWVLGMFATLMVVLSLSMFNVYQLQVPAALQSRLSSVSSRYADGKLVGVFVMGMISALIVGPCVAAPLAGVLMYISQSRDALLGGAALFTLAAGMSVPLLLIGASAKTLLPKVGAWMESVKQFFGVMMLATALWMVQPVLPVWLSMAAWGLLGVGYGAYLLFAGARAWPAKALGIVVTLLGCLQLVGVATGGRDVLAPLGHLTGQAKEHVSFERVRSSAELDAALQRHAGKLVMLDFYADWCVSCIEMERFTFPEPRVKAQLDQMVLLQIDVTANNSDDRAMLKRFNLFGPPGIMFFDRSGQELQHQRVIGYQNADKFLQTLLSLE
jgi:thiol:disulfide interchange protein DsbD